MSFSADLTAYINRTNRRASEVQRAVALQLTSSVITRTPVDTGRARGNWNAEINRADNSTSDTRTASDAERQARQASDDFAPGTVLFLTNALPYIRALEYGNHSRQAPRGMVRITAEEFAQAVRRAARNVR